MSDIIILKNICKEYYSMSSNRFDFFLISMLSSNRNISNKKIRKSLSLILLILNLFKKYETLNFAKLLFSYFNLKEYNIFKYNFFYFKKLIF